MINNVYFTHLAENPHNYGVTHFATKKERLTESEFKEEPIMKHVSIVSLRAYDDVKVFRSYKMTTNK